MTIENATTLPHSIDPAAFLDIFVRSGLPANELRVAASLARRAVLIEGEPSVQLARWEIAAETGLSQASVQRALSALAAAGLVGRSQDAKVKGEIAITTVTERLLELFGLSGGIQAPADVPAELLNLLVREPVDVANAITSAWTACTVPSQSVASQFRGGAKRWAQVEFLLLGRIESEGIKAMAAATNHDEELPYSETRVALQDGTEIEFCSDRFKALVPENDTAMAGADLRFAASVLGLLAERAPAILSTRSATALAAEALYSRQKGFVFKHDFSDATRVVASIMAKGTWSRPKGIDASWYAAVGASMTVAHRVFKSAPLNS